MGFLSSIHSIQNVAIVKLDHCSKIRPTEFSQHRFVTYTLTVGTETLPVLIFVTNKQEILYVWLYCLETALRFFGCQFNYTNVGIFVLHHEFRLRNLCDTLFALCLLLMFSLFC